MPLRQMIENDFGEEPLEGDDIGNSFPEGLKAP